MTTNQTLFRQLLEGGFLDERLRTFKAQGDPPAAIYRRLYNEAATAAAGVFGAIHSRWPWEGRVSQEASALLTDLEPLVKDVQRIARAMNGMGAFTKIPNLPIGPQAIEEALAGEGRVHPNVTLVFSECHYLDTVEGYLKGLNRCQGDLSQIHSVNSLFVSRVDRVVDPMIEEQLQKGPSPHFDLQLLKGKVGVAQAKRVYRLFESIFLGAASNDLQVKKLQTLFASLRGRGANPQRLLVASTGVKSDQPYSQLLYVLPFLGPWVANTMPEATLAAFSRFVAGLSDQETSVLKKRALIREPLPAVPTDSPNWDQLLLTTPEERKAQGIVELTSDQILETVEGLVLKPQGTSLRKICDTLRDKGAASFKTDEEATLQAIQTKLQTL